MLTLEEIVREIQYISDEYQKNQGLILSEDDLKCHIFRKIYDLIPNHSMRTHDSEITGSPLHSEIRFYDEYGKLRIAPDITILDPAGMTIKSGISSIRIKDNRLAYGDLPSCGFEFRGKTIIIEIKFEKSKAGISQTKVQKIRNDLGKIARLMERHNRDEVNTFGIMVIFNKTNKYDLSFKQLIQEYETNDSLKIVYGTGNVIFTPRSQVQLGNEE